LKPPPFSHTWSRVLEVQSLFRSTRGFSRGHYLLNYCHTLYPTRPDFATQFLCQYGGELRKGRYPFLLPYLPRQMMLELWQKV
jgi:hypothetical protein